MQAADFKNSRSAIFNSPRNPGIRNSGIRNSGIRKQI